MVRVMPRSLSGVIATAVALSLAQAALSAPIDKKRDVTKHRVVRHWHGYGFLPGYRPPEVIERELGAPLPSVRPAILRPSLAGLLPWALERRRLRSLLDADTDWPNVELWPINSAHFLPCNRGTYPK